MRTILIESDGKFELYKTISPVKYYGTTSGYYRNVKTGENCGQNIELYEGDEDCYELIAGDESNVK